MFGSVSYNPMNGRLTVGAKSSFSYEVAKPQDDSSNQWCSTENNRNNARNVNFNNGNANNNNKNNGNVVRPVAASQDYDVPAAFVESVWEAYFDCLHGKMRSKQAVEYMEIANEDIPRLAYELWHGTYKPGTSTCFLVHYPKLREVFAANFRDRIVHHWVCLRLNPLFEERFEKQGNVSFNCRKGYGTEKAVQYVADGIKRVSENYRKPASVFKGDLVGFFMSIDKDLLWYLLDRFIHRQRIRYERNGWKTLDTAILARLNMECMPEMYWDILARTTKVIVMHHPELDCVLNTDPREWLNLAPNKSLFTSPTGEPIGNLTTQLFANFLMSFFVSYVQWLYRRKNYCFAQFVDDFTIVCDDLPFLVNSIPKLEAFLCKLHLSLHKDKRYLQPVSHGVKFVGAFIKPGRIYLANSTVSRMKERFNGYGKMMAERELEFYERERIEQVFNSYLGFTRRRRTYKFRKEGIEGMGHDFWRNFYVKGRYETVRSRKNIKARQQ
jgi:hypothetical protein